MKNLTGGKSAGEDLSGALGQLKTDLKDLLQKGGSSGGLTEADRTFLKELSNETKDAIQDMRLEVLTASDKSKLRFCGQTFSQQIKSFFRLRQNRHAH